MDFRLLFPVIRKKNKLFKTNYGIDIYVFDDSSSSGGRAKNGEDVYRLCNSMEFPLSYYRQVYEFKENGACRYLRLSPVDAHFFAIGKWKYNETSKLIKISNENNEVLTTLKVIEDAQNGKLIL